MNLIPTTKNKNENPDVPKNRDDKPDVPKNRDNKPDVEPTRTSGNEVDKDKPADPCSSPIDAITVIRTDIFLFIGKV